MAADQTPVKPNTCPPNEILTVQPVEFDLNLRPGVHMSPPSLNNEHRRIGMRSPPGLGTSPAQPTNSHMAASPNKNSIDDLSLSFGGSFNVTNNLNDTNRPHPRLAQFKMKTPKVDQEERRRRLLEHQKNKRDEAVNHARALALGEFEDEGDGDDDEEDMDTTEVRPRRFRKTYRNQLMLSEWLVEVPEDLQTNWIFILCPEGRRNFVIASNGSTKVYSKSGMQVKSFPSNLPGGSRGQKRSRDSYTLLDCIFSEAKGVFYILDMMCWNGFEYYNCDTEFRFMWVQQQFIENQSLLVNKSKKNPYSFQPLPVYECTPASFSSALNSPMPFHDKLDGILIYHKQVHYMPGTTPLVGWLKAYMVPELMDIPVCEDLMQQKPQDYAGIKVALKKDIEKKERLKENQHSRHYQGGASPADGAGHQHMQTDQKHA